MPEVLQEKTIEVEGMFGGTKRINKRKYVQTWTNHANELKKIGIDVFDQTAKAAAEEFDNIWENQNAD